MKIHTAKDEIRKLCGLEPLEELYTDDDLVENFTQYLEQKFPAEDTTEIEFVKPWLKEMGYRVEMPRAQNPVWDMKVYKRGVGTFLVQVKHSREIKDKNIREFIKEAKVQGIGAWWIALGLIDKDKIKKFEQYSEDLAIWGSREIYETFIDEYVDYSRTFQKIVPLRWSLLP